MEAWLSRLENGDPTAAWALFEGRYRRLILATIRRLLHDHDDVMDVYAGVCASLTANDFDRLRRYSVRSASGATVCTWLVIVVRNLVVDWLRKSSGRRRTPVIPGDLAGLQRAIYSALCVEELSRVEAFEAVRTRLGLSLTFVEFLRQLRLLRETHPCPEALPTRRPQLKTLDVEVTVPSSDPAEVAETARRVATALATLPDDVRLAVQLYVVDELPAARVAALAGWPNAKAVYNRVHRALAAIRTTLEREGVGRGDL